MRRMCEGGVTKIFENAFRHLLTHLGSRKLTATVTATRTEEQVQYDTNRDGASRQTVENNTRRTNVDTIPSDYEPEGRLFESARAHHKNQPLDFDIRGLGRRLPRTDAPEGWLKKVARSLEGKVWVGFLHLWTTNANGRRVRTKKEKTLGPASMAKHEAREKLTEYITEYAGRLRSQGNSITTFSELWKAFCAVKSGQWSKKTNENLLCLFAKRVLPIAGNQPPREVTLTSLQLLLSKMADHGYRNSAVGQVRTYLTSCFEYAADEDVIQKSPARKLAMPNIQKKSCERFLRSQTKRNVEPGGVTSVHEQLNHPIGWANPPQ